MTEWRPVPLDASGRWRRHTLHLSVDENLPTYLAGSLLKRHSFRTEWQPKGLADEELAQIARRKHVVLLTKDDDFWDDHKHPVVSTGDVILATGTPDAFCDLVTWYSRLFITWDYRDWQGTKAKFVQGRLRLKRRCRYVGVHEMEFDVRTGQAMQRDLNRSHPAR